MHLSRLVPCLALCGITLSMLLLTACGGSSSSDNTLTAPLTVWVDQTRVDAIKAYQKAHPNAQLKVVTVNPSDLPAKVLLANNIGSGWPDVVFTGPDIIAKVDDAAHHFPADLTPYVSADIRNNFAPGALASCTLNGKLYCLRNDLAQEVLWYNKKLMDQFGYTVPTTWEEYQALGLRVAKEHPGYLVGALTSYGTEYNYFWPSGCPLNKIVGNSAVEINAADAKCTRVATMLDALIGAGVFLKDGVFGDAFIKAGTEDKILMLPEASWFGEYVFKTTYKTPNGELAAALPLAWSGETAFGGAHGGGAWAMSSHTTHTVAAIDLITWLSTSNDVQATAPTFPAYLPAADAWHATIQNSSFYASDPYPILKQAAGLIRPDWAYVRYDIEGTFYTTVIATVGTGGTVSASLPEWGKDLIPLAQAAGYDVQTP